jgi:hypothetical protein
LLTPGYPILHQDIRLELYRFLHCFRVCGGFAANFPPRMVLEQHTQDSAGPLVVVGDRDSSHISVRSNYREVSRLFSSIRRHTRIAVGQVALVACSTRAPHGT